MRQPSPRAPVGPGATAARSTELYAWRDGVILIDPESRWPDEHLIIGASPSDQGLFIRLPRFLQLVPGAMQNAQASCPEARAEKTKPEARARSEAGEPADY